MFLRITFDYDLDDKKIFNTIIHIIKIEMNKINCESLGIFYDQFLLIYPFIIYRFIKSDFINLYKIQ